MSDKVLFDSIAKLSVKRSLSSRSEESDDEAVASKRAFDGLLQSYLNRRDRTSVGTEKGKSSLLFDPLAGAAEKKAKHEASKDAIRDKAEEDGEASERYAENAGVSGFAEYFALLTEDGPIDDAMAGAAAEAAKIILDLLRGGGVAQSGVSVLAALSGSLGGASGGALSGLDAGSIGSAEMSGAIDAANVSAEMNNEAVSSTLEDLLTGMPKNALEQALRDLSGGKGEAGIVEATLAALNGTVVSSGEEAAAADLLARLGLQDNASGRLASDAANSAGETNLNDLLDKYLKENSGNISDSANAESVDRKQASQGFRGWLESNGMSAGVKMLDAATASFGENAGGNGFGGGFGGGGSGAGEFSKNLESVLQNKSGVSANEIAEALSGASAEKPAQETAAAESKATPERQSAILDQIGNIERIAEIMRHNNRQGVQNLTMQLTPAELGRVLIRVENRGGKVSATFRVGQAESAAQLQDGLQQLKNNLRAQGIELGEVEVVEDPSLSGEDGGGRAGHERGEAVSGRNAHGGVEGSGAGEAAEAAETAYGVDENGRVNLFA